MKELWLEIDAKNPEKTQLLKQASEICDVVLEESKDGISANKSDLTVLTHLDIDEIAKLKKNRKIVALKVIVKSKEDENTAVKVAAEKAVDYIVISCVDWRVIPLENIIAQSRGKSKILAEVSNAEDARLVLGTLELGTDGVVLKTSSLTELTKTAVIVKQQSLKLDLTTAKIVTTKAIGTGARVCVDTCDIMTRGEGILVGSQSAGLFLVEAEVHENPYVASRPFRVNAGSISMYTLGSLQNTRYLSELKAGEEVIIVNREGKIRKANVGRIKIEFRPLILIEAEVDGKKIKTILQNAETIRLVTPNGSKPVTELKMDDELLVYVEAKGGGRHFGVSVPDETVIEQ
ncbi:MAG: 3-dehydroquinate synthase II [Candidatus Bathyarchaeota archaeon]|nr:3-dehydroquinate synthase II [Candidatus Bathyarchaeota archaeon]